VTLPWRGERGAGIEVQPPPPQRRRPAGVARRPREGPSLRRAAYLRTVGGAADTAHGRVRGRDRRAAGASNRAARWLQKAPTSRQAAATQAGAQARSLRGNRGRVKHWKLLRAVAARNSGLWGGAGEQAPSGPCDPCGRTVLLSYVPPLTSSVIATLSSLTRPQMTDSKSSRTPLRFRHFALCFGDSTAHLYRPTPKPFRHPNHSSIPTITPLVVPDAAPRFTLQRHIALGRTCTTPHTVATVSQRAPAALVPHFPAAMLYLSGTVQL